MTKTRSVVPARWVGDERPASRSLHVFVPNERDAWAEYAEGAFPTWLDVRDEQGLLRARIEPQGVGEYVYACPAEQWPRGSSPPETLEGAEP